MIKCLLIILAIAIIAVVVICGIHIVGEKCDKMIKQEYDD